RTQSSFAAVFFVSAVLLHSDYVGINDPQFIGHALNLAALILILRSHSNSSVAAAALLLSIAFFIKHNLIAMPVALVGWLAIHDRRGALKLAGAGAAFLVLGLIAFRAVYGVDLVSQVNSGRVYSFALLMSGLNDWLSFGILPLIGVALVVCFDRHNKHVQF